MFLNYIFIGKFALCRNKELLVEGSLGINHQYSKQQVLYEYEYLPDSALYVSRQSDHCVKIRWEGVTTKDTPLKDCFDLGSDEDYWFGGYQSFHPQWPIKKESRPRTPFVPRDYTSKSSSNDFGPILHPVWLSSKGVVIYADKNVPLFISFNNQTDGNSICLQAMPHSLNCMENASGPAILQYTVCGFQNMTSATQYFLTESGNVPSTNNTPNSDILKYPIWSTKDALDDDWTQTDVIDYTSTIVNNSYGISLLEIDGKYSNYYGDLEFSSSKFPNIVEFKNTLNDLGITLSATVSPFIDYNSPTFTEAIVNNTLYPEHSDVQGDNVVLVKWLNNLGAVLNMKETVLQQARLQHFMNVNGLVTLAFDGGSETYLPRCVYSEYTIPPTQYTMDYVNFIGQLPYSMKAIVSVGYFSQDSPVLFRLLVQNSSSWGLEDGLGSVIPSVLAVGLGGYSFVFSNANGYPSKELYVRWLQLMAFMPSMQISYPPWKYDSTVTNHVKDLIRLHTEVYTNYTKSLVSETMSKNYPIIRPLWWVEPNYNSDFNFIANNDQFLVGESLLVTPILVPSNNSQYIVSTRHVLFPSGSWKCLSNFCSNQTKFEGPTMHTFHNIRLTDLLYFKLCSNDNC